MELIIGIGVVLLLLIAVMDIALMRMASRTSRQEEWEEEPFLRGCQFEENDIE